MMKKLIAIFLALIMTVSIATAAVVNVSAAAGDKVYCRANFTPYCYMWKKNTEENNQGWPGVAMTKVSGETNLYSYTVPDNKFDMIIFNNGGNGDQTPDMDFPGGNKLYDYTARTWSDYSADPVPSITVSKEGGSFKGSVDVTITVTDASSAYYTIDGANSRLFSGTTTVTLGAYIAEGASVKLDVYASNSYGTVSKSYTYKKRISGGSNDSDGSTSPALSGNYATNPNGGYGARKTITVDGDKSDWDSSMLIAQGVANDDPRVYAHWSMHEKAIDDYAMYAAWDNTNLYIMYEMANVQDVVAPGEDFPMSQGNLWIDNLPVFLYVYTGSGNITHNETGDGTGTLWGTGTTIDANSDHVIAFSTNASNGPFIYTANDDGKLMPDTLVKKGAETGINIKWGNGKTLSGKLMGIPKAGTDNKRVAGDCVDAALSDFYSMGHSAKLDMFYEISIPLRNLDISASDIETNGIGVMKISTFGISGMDCLPYDLSMADNAAQPYSKDSSTSAEKEDEDHITVPMARVGTASPSGPVNPVTPTTPYVIPTDPYVPPTEAGEKAILGDADNDGTVTIFDATAIQRYLAGIPVYPFNETAADADGLNGITILDATAIQRYLAGLPVSGRIGDPI